MPYGKRIQTIINYGYNKNTLGPNKFKVIII